MTAYESLYKRLLLFSCNVCLSIDMKNRCKDKN